MNTKSYSVQDVCKILGVSDTTIYNAVSGGRLKAFRVGARTLRITEKALLDFMEAATAPKPAPAPAPKPPIVFFDKLVNEASTAPDAVPVQFLDVPAPKLNHARGAEPEVLIVTDAPAVAEWLELSGVHGRVIARATPADVRGRIVYSDVFMPYYIACEAVKYYKVRFHKAPRGIDYATVTLADLLTWGVSLDIYRITRE